MSRLAQYLLGRFYKSKPHPYRIYEQTIERLLPQAAVILDAGCGRTAPTLAKFRNLGKKLIGMDLVDFRDVPEDITTVQGDLTNIPLPAGTVDLIISQSVFEHLAEPEQVYRELARVLRPGGRVIFRLSRNRCIENSRACCALAAGSFS